MIRNSFLLLFVFLASVQITSAAYTVEFKNAFEVPELKDISGETIYGSLQDYPHTFTFSVSEETPFSMQVSMNAKQEYRDVSLILVKQEKRGVSEIGRVDGKKAVWNDSYDFLRAVTFTQSPKAEYILQSGTYRVEVSAPENNRNYRLVVGEGDFSVLKEIFMVRNVFEVRPWGILLSPFVFGFLLLTLGLLYYRKKKKHVS